MESIIQVIINNVRTANGEYLLLLLIVVFCLSSLLFFVSIVEYFGGTVANLLYKVKVSSIYENLNLQGNRVRVVNLYDDKVVFYYTEKEGEVLEKKDEPVYIPFDTVSKKFFIQNFKKVK